MNMPTRILLVTHSAGLPTGLAEATRLIFETLLDEYPDQYDIRQVGLAHSCAVAVPKWTVIPTKSRVDDSGRLAFINRDILGELTVSEVVADYAPDIVFAFNDPQCVQHLLWLTKLPTLQLILYITLDGVPVPPHYDGLAGAHVLATMSEWSMKAFLAAHGSVSPRKVTWIYPPSDTERFKPVEPPLKQVLRAELFPAWFPSDAFVIGWVGVNQWRKQMWVVYYLIHLIRTGSYICCVDCMFARASHATLVVDTAAEPLSLRWARLGEVTIASPLCPRCGSSKWTQGLSLKDVVLWMHVPQESGHNTWPIETLQAMYDVRPGRDVYYTEGLTHNSRLTPHDMPTLFQIWGVLLCLSGGEGFGMPVWEAMSTGLPCVVTNYSTHGELVSRAGAGITVGGQLQPEPGSCILRMVPDVDQALTAILNLYHNRDLCVTYGNAGRLFALRHSCKAQAPRWHALLQGRMSEG
jgi:glycosyltransferase involved in cell wall biosynthesis